VKSKAIKGIDDIVVTRPGPRLVDGLLLLVAAIHPELGLAAHRRLRRADDRVTSGFRRGSRPGPRFRSPCGATGGRSSSRASASWDSPSRFLAGVGFGSVAVAPGDTLGILAHRLLGLDIARTWSPTAETIVWELRLPRVLEAAVVGLGLAVAGTTFQGLLRNPLADPYVLGTASGAALGAAIAVILPIRIEILAFGLLQALAFFGALGAVTAVYRLSRVGGAAPMTSLLLTGYALGVPAGRGSRDGDVPVGRRAPPDLLVPPRQLRQRLVGPSSRAPPRSSSAPRSSCSSGRGP